jgi:hypothetical protein
MGRFWKRISPTNAGTPHEIAPKEKDVAQQNEKGSMKKKRGTMATWNLKHIMQGLYSMAVQDANHDLFEFFLELKKLHYETHPAILDIVNVNVAGEERSPLNNAILAKNTKMVEILLGTEGKI